VFGPEGRGPRRRESAKQRLEFLDLLRLAIAAGYSSCIEWPWSRDKGGYGTFANAKGDSRTAAHRWVYTALVGPIPADQQVRHTCDNPPCVFPAHFLLGSSADNHRDMVERGRSTSGERNPRATITLGDVALVLRLAAIGWTYRAIAERVGASPQHVGRLVRSERWDGAIRREYGRFWT
jgi:hypothetical protein